MKAKLQPHRARRGLPAIAVGSRLNIRRGGHFTVHRRGSRQRESIRTASAWRSSNIWWLETMGVV